MSISEIQFLERFRCVERREQEQGKKRDYTVYNCDAYMKVNKDNIKQVIEEALHTATQLNAVIRLFRVIQLTPTHSVSITVTRGGLISIDIRFPPRIGGFQNVLTIRVDEVGVLKALVDQLSELVQGLIA
jgi:hypothetical protein